MMMCPLASRRMGTGGGWLLVCGYLYSFLGWGGWGLGMGSISSKRSKPMSMSSSSSSTWLLLSSLLPSDDVFKFLLSTAIPRSVSSSSLTLP
ncbi:hypothetical protein BJX65DRAFT_290201 [Aspergillus insuetus]